MKLSLFFSFSAVFLFSTPTLATYDPVQMLCMVNQQRATAGLSMLGFDVRLANVAQDHSNYQASINTMTHDQSGYSDAGSRISAFGYTNWRSCGENIAEGFGDEVTCMQEWMNSPGHRANILGASYTHFGSALAYSSDGTPYYTQDFAGDGNTYSFPSCPGNTTIAYPSTTSTTASSSMSAQSSQEQYQNSTTTTTYNGQDNTPSGDVDSDSSNSSPDNTNESTPSYAPATTYTPASTYAPAPTYTPAPSYTSAPTYTSSPSPSYGQAPSYSQTPSYGQAPSYSQAPASTYAAPSQLFGSQPTTSNYFSTPSPSISMPTSFGSGSMGGFGSQMQSSGSSLLGNVGGTTQDIIGSGFPNLGF